MAKSKIAIVTDTRITSYNVCYTKLLRLRCERYVVDAKSILGVLSLNLKQELIVDIYAGDLEEKIQKFIVEE